jgi:2-dehydro-3-deoxyphosphooctonate aldolase (KDO 8-P synthase)
MNLFETIKTKLFIIAGPNVIESDEHTMMMAKELKKIFQRYDVNFIFKVSFDKANRTSLNSYRGVGFEEGLRILKKVKDEIQVPILTDVHESWQAGPISEVVDIIQIPAFLCRQTDLLKAVAETGKIIHVKKGQFCNADVMHKTKEKLIAFGNDKIILCERGNTFGYQDLVVDPRNLIWLKSDSNLVSMDITHCLQQPSQKMTDGTVKSGGLRDLIPWMGKIALALEVNGIFMEVHNQPDESLCDGPTQWYLDKLEWLLDWLNIEKDIIYNLNYSSSALKFEKAKLGTIEKDISGLNGNFEKEDIRGLKILEKFLKYEFRTILDIGAGSMEHSKKIIEHGKIVDVCDLGTSVYFKMKTDDILKQINKVYIGDFNNITFDNKYDAIWCSHILEHQPNVNLFLKKIWTGLKEGGILGIVVPPRKPFIVGGHVTIWNAGLLLYNLILAGFDCSKDCHILQYDYNIGVILKKKSITKLPELTMDKGDIELLSEYFPFKVKHNFNGDILRYNWDEF